MLEELARTVRACVGNKSRQCGNLWGEPLVRAVSSDRKEILALKETVSPRHLSPLEILPDAKGIVCFFVPFDVKVSESNIGGRYASAEWARAYILTNELIAEISDGIERFLNARGFRAGKIPATHNFDAETLLSDWSHRHVAAAAGLGTFGINNMLITDRGCCGRLGSVVTNCEFEYGDEGAMAERCLFKRDGSCGACLKKCFTGAYADNGYDRHRCYAVCLENAAHHADIGYADVCGKCLVGLPCSAKDPSKAKGWTP